MPDVLTSPATGAPAPGREPDLFGGELPLDPRPSASAGAIPGERPWTPTRRRRPGLPPVTIFLATVAVAALLWAAWITKAVRELSAQETPIAAVRLQPLIEEYVQRQARAGTPEDVVMRQTKAFMDALESEIARRGKSGETILVAEAVLSKNVPDITGEVRRAVYARVPAPAAAPAALTGPAPARAMGGGYVR